MSVAKRASVYERLRPKLDAADLIQRLGLDLRRKLGSEAYCAPLCHESTSGESLQINLHTGRWNCKACQSQGVYGDLFQLVEYVRTGGRAPSRGNAQGGSPTHRDAVAWLCEQLGVPYDEHRLGGDAGLDVVHLFAMAAHEHLLRSPAMLEWIREKWGFDQGTVEAYGIGFMPSPLLPAIVNEAERHESRGAFRASGLGWFTNEGRWRTRFEGRVTFPYLEHGRAVYLIGRATPQTPALDSGRDAPKYHKLSVHSEQRPYISERITNDHLYNEPVMSSTDVVVVAEGVADAVALSSLGVPVVSPVTISFNATDLERFTRKSREQGIKRVEILFDNELSGSGNYAARRTGVKLAEHGLCVKVLTLPLGEEQERARDEVVNVLGAELFNDLELAAPADRKRMIVEAVPDEARREWILRQVQASKIDAAEWAALEGAGAPGRFDAIRRDGRDVIDLEVEDLLGEEILADPESLPEERAELFRESATLAAYVDNALARESYAGRIAKAAGRGVTKAYVSKWISGIRREVVKPERKGQEQEEQVSHAEVERELVLLPPETRHTPPPAPPAPTSPANPNAPPAPPAPSQAPPSDHERYAPVRDSVAKAVEAKLAEETLGEYVSQTILRSMGYTPFRTPEELYLVRGNERIPVGLERPTPRFAKLLWLASGLTNTKTSHRAYIASVRYFLERDSREASDVSWSHVSRDRAVFFPTGDELGQILKIEPGRVSQTKMSEARVPAVSGSEFEPFRYVEERGGIDRALEAFKWTSISPGSRLVLIHWIASLPILRLIGTVPIVRVEGGSSSGKTRTVDAVTYLVNGRKSAVVPTPAALASRMAREMLTVDDNREAIDVSPQLQGTLLQATHLGAREKRKSNSDTGTIVERICGALLMNGVEPIHDGKSELASRMLTLRCSSKYRLPSSPAADIELERALVGARDAFWSEAVRRCAYALELDQAHGEAIGAMIESIFGTTKIGRLSSYLRIMYLTWVVGLDARGQAFALDAIADEWVDAFGSIAAGSLESLLAEELAVSTLRYVFSYGASVAEPIYSGATEKHAFGERFVMDTDKGDAYLGPIRATAIARLARMAGKEMNAPRAVTQDLRAGQLERRIIDGVGFLEAAGFDVDVTTTSKGKHRFTFRRVTPKPQALPAGEEDEQAGDSWVAPMV